MIIMAIPEESESKYGTFGRYLGLGSEIPCMVVVGVLVGNLLAQQYDGFWSVWGVILGALIGFFIGVFNIYAIVRREEIENENKKN